MTTSAPDPRAAPPVVWQPWSPAAFARAADERKPVLLSIGASWCHGCAVMDRTTYADAAVRALIADRVVAVRVDADRRPDVNDRYNLEGWPTTALLTPSGEILTGSTYVTADLMPRMLIEAADALRDRYDAIMARAGDVARARRQRPVARFEPDASAPSRIVARMLADHDDQHGGFGRDGKFLHVPALQLAVLRLRAHDDERLAAVLRSTLDGMLGGGMYDTVDGGFFRYAAGRDWRRPHTEKMLDDQAALIPVLFAAAERLEEPAYARHAEAVLAYVQRVLSDRQRGGFYHSQAADDAFYAGTGTIRETMDSPSVNRTLFVDANASAAAVWLAVAAARGEPALAQFAVASLERVVTGTYQPGDGVAHFVPDGEEVRGLLGDQVHAAAALLEAEAATGNEAYGMLAEELMRTALRTMWDEEAGGFTDRRSSPSDLGLLRDPVKPFALNCLAARVLHRLAGRAGSAELAQRAWSALASQTGVYAQYGVDGAPYALAALELFGDQS